MRYLGGVVGFAWAASVPPRNPPGAPSLREIMCSGIRSDVQTGFDE